MLKPDVSVGLVDGQVAVLLDRPPFRRRHIIREHDVAVDGLQPLSIRVQSAPAPLTRDVRVGSLLFREHLPHAEHGKVPA